LSVEKTFLEKNMLKYAAIVVVSAASLATGFTLAQASHAAKVPAGRYTELTRYTDVKANYPGYGGITYQVDQALATFCDKSRHNLIYMAALVQSGALSNTAPAIDVVPHGC
jgi:hypothetical protein